MISSFEFYNENLKKDPPVDIYDQIAPFRIFRIKDYTNEPVPIYNDEAWINSTETFPQNYLILETLYESEFIKVKLCRNKQTHEQVAIKFIRLMKPTMELKIKSRHDRINREISIVKEIDHVYIIGVLEVIKLVDCVAIVMEYASNGELFEFVRKRHRLSELLAKKIMFQIFLAVDNLHSNGIVHRDLKLENILLDDRMDVKIADFGFANYWNEPDGKVISDLLTTSCGSPCYAAPEIVLKDRGYSGFPVDIWSCGVILFALLFGHLPFEDQALKQKHNRQSDRKSSINVYHLYQFISNNNLETPKHVTVSTEAIDLIKGMLRCDPGKRMTLSEIFRHSWFANSDFM